MTNYDAYGNFAAYYDELTEDIPYEKWADYFKMLFDKYGINPEIILDLACGTGNMTLTLAKRGYDMIGIDSSLEMLGVAREKAAGDSSVLFLSQGMTDFELYGTVGAIVCCLDSINYLTDEQALLHCFELANLYLDPGGLFIFDINTPYKFQNILGNETFVLENERVFVVWQNEFDETSQTCTMDLDFFEYVKEQDFSYKETALKTENSHLLSNSTDREYYTRFHETHTEHVYECDRIIALLKRAGFEYVDVYGELSLSPPREDEERVFFAARASAQKTPVSEKI